LRRPDAPQTGTLEGRMPTTKSAIKRAKTDEKRRQQNAAFVSKTRSQRRKVVQAIEARNKADAEKGFTALVSLYDKGVKKRILKLNTVSRHKSRLAARIKALPA
jgi:small subunit ribosomal protein S20